MDMNTVNRTGYQINAASAVTSEEKRFGSQNVKVETTAAVDAPRGAVEDRYVPNEAVEGLGEACYTQPKRLSAEQIEEMKAQIHESMCQMAYKMLGIQSDKAQSMGVDELVDALGLGRTPEEAAEAISENGMWGVNAVASRLMNMAISLSGGDSSKAEMLREAVKKGFAEVGALDSLPQVCQDTYAETMKRFDYWVENGSMDGYGEETE